VSILGLDRLSLKLSMANIYDVVAAGDSGSVDFGRG
jgi:hypothetical protein